MSETKNPELVWLDHVQPVGLVVARAVLDELGLVPAQQTAPDNARVSEYLNVDKPGPALTDAWGFVHQVLGWDATSVIGIPGGPTVPAELCRVLPEHHVTLQPTWAIKGARGEQEPEWQALVRIEDQGTDPDERGALAGWEATPLQRFERLLRETGVPIGVLIADFERDGHKHAELRLIYAPAGETSGWLGWPLLPLATVAGRPMLGGMKLLLDQHSLFTNRRETRLPQVLDASRKAQASVSTELSGQVLGALHALLRGLHAADPKLIEDLAAKHPHHLYEGLLTVLMRLVFILYAEDRDLMPSKTDGRSKTLYEQGYSLRGLYAKLIEDEALYPDTMDERLGGWGRLLALFRLVHKGHPSGWIKGRGGKLFDADEFPFLEGRHKKEDAPRVLHVRDGSILRILRGLMTLKGERLSYRTLDVEQIGSVYETVMGFTVEATAGRALAIKAGKNNRVPVFVDLDAVVAKKPKDRVKALKDDYSRSSVNANQKRAVEEAKTSADLEKALEGLIDERGSPGGIPAAPNTPILQPTDERRRTGSHYTPRTLTEPIVRHALEPAFERLGPDATAEDVLNLKVCDPAMGSGAFLVEACRQIAARLVKTWARWPEARPKIPLDEDEELHAKRIVAQRCLYGVDKNPMATDLAKLSLWLATLARDHEFEFVDHALKTGDSLVGLTNDQVAATTWETDKMGLPLFRKLVADRIKESSKGRQEIRDAPDDVFRAVQEARHRNAEERITPIRVVGDAIISAFFAEAKTKAREKERQRIESLLTGKLEMNLVELFSSARRLSVGDHPIRPFHWQLEFPEVFEGKNAGFDAMVGNPPFMGGTVISAHLGMRYFDFLTSMYSGASHHCDLIAYFFRRAYALLRANGVLGLIATNTVSQGDTREGGLLQLLSEGATIIRALRRYSWPGEAAVIVSVIHIKKGPTDSGIMLDSRPASRVSAYLVDGGQDASPRRLAQNPYISLGSKIYGQGFLFSSTDKGASSPEDRLSIIAEHPLLNCRILPYVGGDEVNSDPVHAANRYVIYLSDIENEDQLVDLDPLTTIVREKVKPERMRLGNNPNSIPLKKKWWAYQAHRPELYRRVAKCRFVIGISQTTKYICFARLRTGLVYSQKLNIVASDSWALFGSLQSRLHEHWALVFGSTLEDRPVYTIADCYQTFAFPPRYVSESDLETTGHAYHEHRAALMVARNEGLTKTYNRFHDPNENSTDIVKLRELHDAMDRAVLTAYGWTDLAERIATDPDAKARHLTEDTEDDHKYQGRYFWPAAIRDEVLARLLALNAERAEQERLAGLEPVAGDDDSDDPEESDEEAA